MRVAAFLTLVFFLSGCASSILRDDLDLGLFPSKIDIPSLECTKPAAGFSGALPDRRFSAASVHYLLHAAYEPAGSESSLQLYVMRAKDSRSAYALFSAFHNDTLAYIPSIEGFASETEGVFRRGTLCVYAAVSRKYPLSRTDLLSVLAFAAKNSGSGGEVFPPPAVAFSTKERPLRYTEGAMDQYFGLDQVYSGFSSLIPGTESVFFSKRDSGHEASLMIQSMMSRCRGEVVLLESSVDQTVFLHEAGRSPLFTGIHGRWVCGVAGNLSLEEGKKRMKELFTRLDSLSKSSIEKD
jgi:hypothetical protein